ncbi:MFS transporter [Cohnella caldifontis]|uniref:MFS transporter n=1 Tax=Cohnella caldifontis TaxID=3027471 RepID=UPI0023EB0060|nr:MFS transporter [Cohnella sp. YIM B05605]
MLERLYKRTLWIVVISQVFGGWGLAAGVTVGALLAQDMLGTDSAAGVPSALITLGSAAAALAIGRLSQRFGRRKGLAAGFLAGGAGAAGVILAAVNGSIPLLLVSMLVYGVGTATNLQARYAGTDLAKPTQRARAVSIGLVSTTLGAVSGPNLVGVMENFATSLGIPALAGPFLLAGAAFALAGLVILALLRPDPFLVAKAIAEAENGTAGDAPVSGRSAPAAGKRGIGVGAAVMVLTQIVMVGIMTMTPIHMQHHGFGIGAVGLVIGCHIGAMYLPSLLTGALADKFGRTAMAIAAGAVLLSVGLVVSLTGAHTLAALITALVLLGLGWNFGLISGTALIVDAAPPAVRAKTQGTVDVLVALSGAAGGALSGPVAAHSSFQTLSLAGGFLSLLLIPVVVWSRGARKANKPEGVPL